MSIFRKEFWEKVLPYFKYKNYLPGNFSSEDLYKYNRKNMLSMINQSESHKLIYQFFRELEESGLFKKSDFIDEYGKFNSGNFFKNIDRIIILLYFILLNNEKIKIKVTVDFYQKPTSGNSYTTSVCEEQKNISEYDRFVFRIVYLTIVTIFYEPEMFHLINEEILGKNNSEQNSSEPILIKTQFYGFFGEDELSSNKKWPKTPLTQPKLVNLEDKSSKLFSREHNPVLQHLKCLENSKEDCTTCRNCNLKKGTSRFPFMIIRNGTEFTLIDVARNFYLIDCESNKILETNTKLEIDRIYTINYGTSTIVYQIIKKE